MNLDLCPYSTKPFNLLQAHKLFIVFAIHIIVHNHKEFHSNNNNLKVFKKQSSENTNISSEIKQRVHANCIEENWDW